MTYNRSGGRSDEHSTVLFDWFVGYITLTRMTSVLTLLPLALSLVLLTAFVKLAAFIRRRTRLAWKHGFAYVFIVLLVVLAFRLALSSTGFVVPALLAGVFGLLLQLALGSFYFATRATTPDGVPIGRSGGAQVAGIFFGLVVIVGGLSFFVVRMFLPGAP
jgi:hypothetical protein